jgi:hypothetical protein
MTVPRGSETRTVTSGYRQQRPSFVQQPDISYKSPTQNTDQERIKGFNLNITIHSYSNDSLEHYKE